MGCKTSGVWEVHQCRGSCLESARILPSCAPGAAPSATTLGTPRGELSCPKKAEAQILSCGRTVEFLQAAVVGVLSQLSCAGDTVCWVWGWAQTNCSGSSHSKDTAVPGEFQRYYRAAAAKAAGLGLSALSSRELCCWLSLLCIYDDGDGTDTLEFLVFRIFLWWQVWILSFPRTPGSQEFASGQNGAGQSCARLILKVKPPSEEGGV